MAINYFRSVQPANVGQRGLFWTNQTGQAALRVFTEAFSRGLSLGWLIAHGVDYGIYLEKCNDGKHAALWLIIKRFSGRYFNDVRRLYVD